MTRLDPKDPLISVIAVRHGLHRDWLVALMTIESSLVIDPTPRYEPHLFEHSYGLGQVLPSTALWMVRSPSTFPILTRLRELILDAAKETGWHGEKKVNEWFQSKEVGIELAAAYLGYQYRRYSENLDKAVASYNAGSARYKEGKFVNEGYVIKFHRALHRLSHD